MRRHGNRGGEPPGPITFCNEQRGDPEQLIGELRRDRPVPAARLRDIPPVDGDLNSPRARHDARGQPAAANGHLVVGRACPRAENLASAAPQRGDHLDSRAGVADRAHRAGDGTEVDVTGSMASCNATRESFMSLRPADRRPRFLSAQAQGRPRRRRIPAADLPRHRQASRADVPAAPGLAVTRIIFTQPGSHTHTRHRRCNQTTSAPKTTPRSDPRRCQTPAPYSKNRPPPEFCRSETGNSVGNPWVAEARGFEPRMGANPNRISSAAP